MKVLIWHDKHGDSLWDASTKDLEAAAFLRMVEILDHNDYYVDVTSETLEELEKEIQAIKNLQVILDKGEFSDIAQRAFGNELEGLPEKENEVKIIRKQLGLLELARKGDSSAAKLLASYRKDYEYEGWSLEKVEDPTLKLTTK